MAGGQIGNYFLRGGLPGGGLGNELVDGLTGGVNNLLCTLVGPDFLRVVLTKNRCPSGVILPNLFKSYKCYCHFYNRQPPNIKKCLSDAAARVDIGLDGIIKLDLLLGICCKNCNTKSKFEMRKNTLFFIILNRFFHFGCRFPTESNDWWSTWP